MSNKPVSQPTSKPQSSGIAFTEFLYVSLALILLVILICLMMYSFKKKCNKQLFGRRSRRRANTNPDVEVIVETEAVVDNTNLVECDIEAARNAPTQSFRDRGSLKRYGSWFGYGSTRRGPSLVVAEEYQGDPSCEVGHAAPMRVMETFQDLSDYNNNSVARALQAALIAQANNRTATSANVAIVTDALRAAAIAEHRRRGVGARGEGGIGAGGQFSGQDHDFLIETQRNTGEVNDQIMRFATSNAQNTHIINYNSNCNNADNDEDCGDRNTMERAAGRERGIQRETREGRQRGINANDEGEGDSSIQGNDSPARSVSYNNFNNDSNGSTTRSNSIVIIHSDSSLVQVDTGDPFDISEGPFNSIFSRTSPNSSISP